MRAQDISQAFLQSVADKVHDVRLRPSEELGVTPRQVLKLIMQIRRMMRPQCGLAESGGRWRHTLKQRLLGDLQLLHMGGDLSACCLHAADQPSGLSGVSVDDAIHAGGSKINE